jgi:bacterioferritin (cytochrome b1)
VAVTKDMLLSELQDLLRLTAFEQTIATVRRSQAASTSIAEELKANAEKSGERRQLLADAVRQLGGVPDVVGAAFGKAGAFAQTQLNQVQTLQGALLGDLALEHSLRERTRYARTLAESLNQRQVLPVLDRLEVAHTATIEWLETRLAEVGRTGTSALKATPVQTAVSIVRRTVGAPLGLFADGVNRASSMLARTGTTAVRTTAAAAGTAASTVAETTADAAGTAADKAGDLTSRAAEATADAVGRAADTASDLAVSAADATATAAGATADATERAVDATAGAVTTAAGAAAQAGEQLTTTAEQDTVLDLTGVEAEKEPFPAYTTLTGDTVIRHAADSEDVDHLREVLAYERAHKSRKGVVSALESRLTELSASV